jgi:predicted aspartyl protease
MKYYPAETKIDGTRIMVKARVWEKSSIAEWFLFDTGSDVVAMPKKVLQKIGAKKLREVLVKGTTGESAGELYTLNFECGGIQVENIEAYASQADYLIGMNFILRAKISFFFNGQQMIWVTP